MMDALLRYGAMIVMAAVAFVLFLGLRNMMRGGDGNYSNKMMRLRIFLQLVALVLIVLTIYFSRYAG